MGKVVFISEKPSVAQQFADALGISFQRRDGYLEAQNTIVTWCYGHLVTMSYPEAYDPKYKRWSMDTLPFIPKKFKYEVIQTPVTKKQYGIVKRLLTSPEVDTIYICTDSGREGEYIYRLVAQEAGVRGKKQLRVWIDSQTKEEIIRGIKQAKDDSAYDDLGAAAYLRAEEDYLMGINFSRALSLRYAGMIAGYLGMDHCVIAVGRVMTCVLGIVVRREREIRAFVKTPFFRVAGTFRKDGEDPAGKASVFLAEWSAVKGSRYFESPKLYRENGFRERKDAEELIAYLKDSTDKDNTPYVTDVAHKKETKNPPLLYNLAELQNDCSRFFKISPDQTLNIAQELYEKKLTTYPRTDARVLSSAVAKEIDKNLKGVGENAMFTPFVQTILNGGSYKSIGKSKYTDDFKITDHYAIIPTGQGLGALGSLNTTSRNVYELIVRRFLAIFYPPAIFDKISLSVDMKGEHFGTSQKVLKEKGYLEVMDYSFFNKRGLQGETRADALFPDRTGESPEKSAEESSDLSGSGQGQGNEALARLLSSMKKGMKLACVSLDIREGETQPPKRYNSGSMILTMENAGQFIEDESLREQIKGSGIGTSATRAEILKKLVTNRYLDLNHKTQIYTPTQLGEMIYDVCDCSIRSLLDPKLTASWEKGLSMVAGGTVSESEYMDKMGTFVTRRTNYVKQTDFTPALKNAFKAEEQYYPKKMSFEKSGYGGKRGSSGYKKGGSTGRGAYGKKGSGTGSAGRKTSGRAASVSAERTSRENGGRTKKDT